MMRTIFLALIVVNFVYFGWNYYHPPEPTHKIPPPLGPEVEILSLLSESKKAPDLDYGSGGQAQALADSAVEENTVDKADRCYSLGPFKNPLDAERVKANIEARGLAVNLRTSTNRVKRGYWVYLPPLANRKTAIETAKELAKQGVEDYLVITGGENENAISLGIFSTAVSAERRLNRIKALGYEPVQAPRYKVATQHWLDYWEVGEKDLPPDFWELLAYSEDKLQRREKDCGSSMDAAGKPVQSAILNVKNIVKSIR